MTVIAATFFGIYLVFLVPLMFDVKNNRMAYIARLLYAIVIVLVVAPSFGIDFLRDFFNFTAPVWKNAWPLLFLIVGAALLQWKIATNAGKRLRTIKS
jgi:protein-S-isoprenylcysteine O-methyltransferase Ste14